MSRQLSEIATHPSALGDRSASRLSPVAHTILERSVGQWGAGEAVHLIGQSDAFTTALERVRKAARYREPLLLTGESGTGKELIAQSVYLLSDLRGKPYVPVNCPQYRDGNLTVSELFGHKRGSFTGANESRDGAFQQADGGVIFLDEIADLHPDAQAMLLRALASGEFQPLGSNRSRRVSVRVIAATNRPLGKLIVTRDFRDDLLYRLRYLLVEVPPLRDRGDDWSLILEHWLDRLAAQHGVHKRFSAESMRLLRDYSWPGNVRQLIGLVTMGYAMTDGVEIEPHSFASQLETHTAAVEARPSELWEVVSSGRADFWHAVHARFINRDLNRRQMRRFIEYGLQRNRWNYQAVVAELRLPAAQYQKFMDFLRHHDLKPPRPGQG